MYIQKYLDSNPKHFGPVLNDLGSMKDGGINFRRYYPKLVKLSFEVSKYQKETKLGSSEPTKIGATFNKYTISKQFCKNAPP